MPFPAKLLAVAILMLGASGCSFFWRYMVPSGRPIYSVEAPGEIRLLVEGSLLNGGARILLEIINEGRGEVWVAPHRVEIRDGGGALVPLAFAKDSPACDGRPQEGGWLLSFRDLCRVQVSFRPRTGERLVLRHDGVVRDGKSIPLSIELRKDER